MFEHCTLPTRPLPPARKRSSLECPEVSPLSRLGRCLPCARPLLPQFLDAGNGHSNGSFQPAALYAPTLLLEVLQDPCPQLLHCWLPQAGAMLAVVRSAGAAGGAAALRAQLPAGERALLTCRGLLEAALLLQVWEQLGVMSCHALP